MKGTLPELTSGHRAYFEYWVDLYTSAGYLEEEAQCGALVKVLGRGPVRLQVLEIWLSEPEEGTG